MKATSVGVCLDLDVDNGVGAGILVGGGGIPHEGQQGVEAVRVPRGPSARIGEEI